MATVRTLLNNILRELRDPVIDATTTSLDEDSYQRLILQFLNQAKEEVEEAWLWKTLRTNITFSTVSGTQDYSLGSGGVGTSATNERSQLIYDKYARPLVYDRTSKTQLFERTLSETTELIAENQTANAKPGVFSQARANTGVTLWIYPAPDAVYSMQATFYVPQDELASSSLTTSLTVPSRPVWRLALARALGERGGLGDTPERIEMMARADLEAAIMRDVEDADLTAMPR